MAPLDHPLDGSARPDEHCLNPPIGQVPDPSADALTQGKPPRAVAKVYTLHEAADEYVRLHPLRSFLRRPVHGVFTPPLRTRPLLLVFSAGGRSAIPHPYE